MKQQTLTSSPNPSSPFFAEVPEFVILFPLPVLEMLLSPELAGPVTWIEGGGGD